MTENVIVFWTKYPFVMKVESYKIDISKVFFQRKKCYLFCHWLVFLEHRITLIFWPIRALLTTEVNYDLRRNRPLHAVNKLRLQTVFANYCSICITTTDGIGVEWVKRTIFLCIMIRKYNVYVMCRFKLLQMKVPDYMLSET